MILLQRVLKEIIPRRHNLQTCYVVYWNELAAAAGTGRLPHTLSKTDHRIIIHLSFHSLNGVLVLLFVLLVAL